MGPTSEVEEPPAQFAYTRGYGQSMFQVLIAEEIIMYDYGTWPVGTLVPTLHRGNPFCGESVGQMPLGYLQYPPQLGYMNTYQW